MNTPLRNTLGPLALMLTTPSFALIIWYTNTQLDGSLTALLKLFQKQGFFSVLWILWKPVIWGSKTAFSMLAIFTAVQLLFLHLPGKRYQGPVSPQGNRPTYKANGFLAWTLTMLSFCLATFYFQWFPASIIYDHFGELLGALNLSSLVFCLFLYLKGLYAPSTTDAGSSGNFLFDYYWGTELYPTIGRLPLKMFIACRMGMMSWGILLLSYVAKQQELSGLANSMLISVALQLIYVGKFFIWESGYLSSLDMMHDRAGFYICWGCLVWVPCVYTSPAMYLVLHPVDLNTWLALFIFIAGAACISINYLADRQRQKVRASDGQCKIWGKKPVTTVASYNTEQGEMKQNILLASGWWGISRHFHYVPEILAAFCWSVPALFYNFLPYFYVCFLTILLVDRAFRDEQRCALKYGDDWQRYCQRVPYKIIPWVL